MSLLRLNTTPLVMLAALAVGCGQRASEPEEASRTLVDTQATSLQGASPQDYLASVFLRYRSTSCYHDRGVVRLEYSADGRRESKIAPMRLWFDHDQLYVEAYDSRIASNRDALTAWINDPATSDFDSQVLRSARIAGRPNLETLLADPILAERLSRGLAGPPPQLEWLFARQPMKHLFHARHKFQFGPSSEIGGQQCNSVRIEVDDAAYQFWIDQRSGAVRRIDLPPVAAPPQPGDAIQLMSLSLELVDASFRKPPSAPGPQGLPEQPKFVRHFVPLPPLEPPAILGAVPNVFQLSDTTGMLRVSNRGTDRQLGILILCSDDSDSTTMAGQIARWYSKIPLALQRRLRIGLIVNGTDLPPALRDLGIPIFGDPDQRAARALGLSVGSLVILSDDGKVMWTQRGLGPTSEHGLVTLGAIVGDLLSGVDVPHRARKQWQDQVAEYQTALKHWLIEDVHEGIHLD